MFIEKLHDFQLEQDNVIVVHESTTLSSVETDHVAVDSITEPLSFTDHTKGRIATLFDEPESFLRKDNDDLRSQKVIVSYPASFFASLPVESMKIIPGPT